MMLLNTREWSAAHSIPGYQRLSCIVCVVKSIAGRPSASHRTTCALRGRCYKRGLLALSLLRRSRGFVSAQ